MPDPPQTEPTSRFPSVSASSSRHYVTARRAGNRSALHRRDRGRADRGSTGRPDAARLPVRRVGGVTVSYLPTSYQLLDNLLDHLASGK